MTFLKEIPFLGLEEKMLEMNEKKPSSCLTEVSLRVLRADLLLSSFSLASISYFFIRSKKI